MSVPSRIRSASLAELHDVGAVDVGDDRLDRDRRVDLPQLARGGLGLGQVVRHVGLVEQHLPLEVARLDEVAVDDADEADAGADQGVGQHGAERAAAAERDARREQLLLPGLADAGEAHLAGVAFERVGIGHREYLGERQA